MTRTASPMLQDAVRRFVRAMHTAFPEIETKGVRPPEPGSFVGEIAGQQVRLVPGKRSSRLFFATEKATVRRTYFRYGFNLFKKGAAPRWDFSDDETRAVLWLINAAVELEEMGDR